MSRKPDDGDGLLSRWSRRKRAVAAETAAETAPAAAPAPEAEPQEPDPDEGLTEPELLEKLGLPDPDTLQKGDDFKAFLQTNIPAALRRRALRRLWRSDPVLANLDGLVDHGEDYTDAATVPGLLGTVYTVGRGMLRDIVAAAPEEDADAAAADAETADPAAPAPDPTVEPGAAAGPAPSTGAAEAPADDTESEPPKPRRMAFRKS